MGRITTTAPSRAARFAEEDLPPQVRQRIAEIAYQLYEERGREPGRELEDWLEAERRVLGKRR